MFSATLHSAEVKQLAASICQQPMLVDLKGKDAVPDTVDHVLVKVDPEADASWLQRSPQVQACVCVMNLLTDVVSNQSIKCVMYCVWRSE